MITSLQNCCLAFRKFETFDRNLNCDLFCKTVAKSKIIIYVRKNYNMYMSENYAMAINVPYFTKKYRFFGVLWNYISEKVWHHWLAFLGSLKHRRRKIMIFLEFWANSVHFMHEEWIEKLISFELNLAASKARLDDVIGSDYRRYQYLRAKCPRKHVPRSMFEAFIL